jgi:hypothetical protein
MCEVRTYFISLLSIYQPALVYNKCFLVYVYNLKLLTTAGYYDVHSVFPSVCMLLYNTHCIREILFLCFINITSLCAIMSHSRDMPDAVSTWYIRKGYKGEKCY